jgi:hypothetical protein
VGLPSSLTSFPSSIFPCAARVTEPPKIIPYYRLSRSPWPLSNNKELLSCFRRVKPGKSHTTGSLICAKPTRRRDQSTTLHYIMSFTSSTLLQTRFFIHKSKQGSEFKQRKIKLAHDTHGRPSMHITPHHRFPIQAPIPLECHQAREDYLKSTN